MALQRDKTVAAMKTSMRRETPGVNPYAYPMRNLTVPAGILRRDGCGSKISHFAPSSRLHHVPPSLSPIPVHNFCMKTALTLIFLIAAVLACGCTAPSSPAPAVPAATGTPAAIPNLTGTWAGPMTGYDESTGFTDYRNDTIAMVVTGQKDRVFNGYFRFFWNGSEQTLGFAGVIGRDGRTLSIVEKDSGYTSGEIISADEIELTYRDAATPYSVAIDSLKRVP